MIPDIDKLLPHRLEHVAVYYTAIQLGLTAVCSWLSHILPPVADVHSNTYKLVYETIQRISWSGRRQWKPNGNGGAGESKS